MPEDTLRLYCPLCDKDYALEAFPAHVAFPKHLMAAAWGLRTTVERLTTIVTLLQQLVDQARHVTPSSPSPPPSSLPDELGNVPSVR